MEAWKETMGLATVGSWVEEADQKAVITALEEAGLKKPCEAEGLSRTDIDEIGQKMENFPRRALLKRALVAAVSRGEAKRQKMTSSIQRHRGYIGQAKRHKKTK